MAKYTVELTEAEDKAMNHVAYSVQDWVDNALKNRASIAIDKIYDEEVERMNADDSVTSIPADKNKVVLDADIKTAKEIHEENLKHMGLWGVPWQILVSPDAWIWKDVKTEIGNVHPDEYKPHYRVQKLKEAKKRDYKAEYKKYGSSKKAKKYRAELNAYNRKKGTYGNGDGKDASHKGGKIVGFEKESVNRGRREKSRLKKEGKLKEGVEPKGGMAKIAAIVKNKQHGKVGGKTVDMQSANLLMKLYNAVKDKDKEKMNKMNEKKLVMVLHKLWSRVNLKLPV